MKVYIGLDIHAKETYYCAEDETGKKIGNSKIPTSVKGFMKMLDKLNKNLSDEEDVKFISGMEAGSTHMRVHKMLVGMPIEVHVINAQEVRTKITKKDRKNDKQDAKEICIGMRKGYYESEIYIPSEQEHRMRMLVLRRIHFVKIKTMEVNAAKSILRHEDFVTMAEKTLRTKSSWDKLVKKVKEKAPQVAKDLENNLSVWEKAENAIEKLEKEMEEIINDDEKKNMDIDNMSKIVGIGFLTAFAFVAYINDAKRFKNSRKLSSYLGLIPKENSSGSVSRRGPITKQGNSVLRHLLVESAGHAVRVNHPLHELYEYMKFKKGGNKAKVIVAHKLARIMWRIMRDGTEFNPELLGIEYVEEQYKTKAGNTKTRIRAISKKRKNREKEEMARIEKIFGDD